MGSIKLPSEPETWSALATVGILFPLHIICGLISLPWLGAKLWAGSWTAIAFCCLYLPFYLYPAQRRFPGWKGFEALWRFMDYTTNCPSYFGEFEVHNAHGVDADAQYFCACHPHGTVIFQRTFWRSQQLAQHLRRDFRMIAASVLFRIPIVREMTLWFGAVDAGRSNCERMLRAGACCPLPMRWRYRCPRAERVGAMLTSIACPDRRERGRLAWGVGRSQLSRRPRRRAHPCSLRCAFSPCAVLSTAARVGTEL